MRILHVIDHLGAGGAQTSLANLTSAWPDQRDRIHVIGLGRKSELRPRFFSPASAVKRVRLLGRSKWSLAAIWELNAALRDGAYDIVHAHLYKSCMAGLWLQPQHDCRLIVHVHSTPQDSRRMFRKSLRRWHSRASLLLAVSEHTRAALLDDLQLAPDRVRTVSNAVRTIVRSEHDRRQLRCELHRELGFEPDRFVLGFVGRLAAAKGLAYLLDVLAQLQNSDLRLGAVLVGDGPLMKPLRRRAHRRGLDRQVRFVGYQPDPSAWFAAFDAAVFPSLTEASPLAVIEAMQNGLPVVATRVGGVPEIIKNDHSGLLVSPADAEELAEAVKRLAESPGLRRQLGERAAACSRQRFAPRNVACQVRKIYSELLPQRTKHQEVKFAGHVS